MAAAERFGGGDRGSPTTRRGRHRKRGLAAIADAGGVAGTPESHGPRHLPSDDSTTTEESTSSSEEEEDYIHEYDIDSMNDWHSMPSSLRSSQKGGSTALTLWQEDRASVTRSEHEEIEQRAREARTRAKRREARRKARWYAHQERKRANHWKWPYKWVCGLARSG